MAQNILGNFRHCNIRMTTGIVSCYLQHIYARYPCQICYASYHNKSINHFDNILGQKQFAGLSAIFQNPLKCKRSNFLDISYSHYAKIRKECKFRGYSTQIKKDKLGDEVLIRFCDKLLGEYNQLSDMAKSVQLKKEDDQRLEYLSNRINVIRDIKTKWKEYEDLLDMRKEYEFGYEDVGDIRVMVEEEMEECKNQLEELKTQLQHLVLPQEKTDHNDVILEVNAAVGGQESMLFTTEIFNMYKNYSMYKGWSFDKLGEKFEVGGTRMASASICGDNVYKILKFEAGVHRVQRVPKTERTGRIHTSTMTVSVMPQPTEIDIVIKPKDLKIDTFKASGAGGQHVNTTDSAVRITHLPTGMKVECQQERSQIQNRVIAMTKLRTNLYQKQIDEQASQSNSQRKLQVGTAGRSEKVRTYNYNQDRITDHRIHLTLNGVQDFLSGGDLLDELIEQLNDESKKEIFQEILQEFDISEKRNQKSDSGKMKKFS